LPTLGFRDEARKKDQHVRDVVDLNIGLDNHLFVEQLCTSLGWEINFRNIQWHGVSSNDNVRSGNSGTKLAKYDGYMDQYLLRSRCPHCLYLWIYF